MTLRVRSIEELRALRGIAAPKKKGNKYRNEKTAVSGVTFDSKRESTRWQELAMLQASGHISELRRQVPIELVPGVKLAGESRARPAMRLIVDFAYVERGKQVYEDVKGKATDKLPMFRAKCHLAKALHGIDVKVVY